MTGRPGARRLIVNADDFGRAPGVSRGIVAAHLRGIVTSTTLMANLPWAAEAAALARMCPRLALGLHLSFCYGPPAAADVPSLLGADSNLNRDLVELRARAEPQEIAREAHAQYARFVALVGRPPTHLDAHLHAHAWPGFQDAVIALAREHALPVRPASAELAATLRAANIPTTDAFINDFFAAGTMTLAGLLRCLSALEPGLTELMCHPGYDDPALADSSFRAQREAELAILTSPEARRAAADHGIELTTYADLAAP